MQLSDMRPGEKGKMSHLKSEDTVAVKKLLNMGFVPGRDIVLDSRESEDSPSVVVVGSQTVVLEPELCGAVYVVVNGL